MINPSIHPSITPFPRIWLFRSDIEIYLTTLFHPTASTTSSVLASGTGRKTSAARIKYLLSSFTISTFIISSGPKPQRLKQLLLDNNSIFNNNKTIQRPFPASDQRILVIPSISTKTLQTLHHRVHIYNHHTLIHQLDGQGPRFTFNFGRA